MTTPVLYSIKDASRAIGGGSINRVYQLIRSGDLKAVKMGGRTLVTGESIAALPARLPAFEGEQVDA